MACGIKLSVNLVVISNLLLTSQVRQLPAERSGGAEISGAQLLRHGEPDEAGGAAEPRVQRLPGGRRGHDVCEL